tara:strand:+ start:6719 stop:8578 length:1860 start_codon:yes stop_codon:yes gene_type:complete
LFRQPFDREKFNASLDAISHYGPDGSASMVTDKFGFGVQRLNLSNKDNSALNPARMADLVAVSDAIVNNRADVEKSLGISSVDARSLSDNDLLLRSYAKWGQACPSHIQGDYAIAIFDQGANTLFLARDHIGTRPLYWAKRNKTFIFSTDIRAILACEDYDWPIDDRTVGRHVMGPSRPLRTTFYKDINILSPGCSLWVERDRVQENRWWDPHNVPEIRYKSSADYVEHFRELMARIGADYTATTGNIGSHISGGIDSSAVTAFASKALQSRGLNLTGAYTWAPPVSEEYPFLSKTDERHNILQIGDDLGVPVRFGTASGATQHHYLEWELELNGIADLSDELPVLEHAKKDGLRVLLSGWGGDEAFSAHGMGYLAYTLKHFQIAEARKVLRFYTGSNRFRPRQSARRLLEWGLTPLLPDTLYLRFAPFVNLFEGGAFASQHVLSMNLDPAPYIGEDIRLISNPRHYLANLMGMQHLNMRMETWAAWSAQFGFQYRYPLLDRRLLEFVLGMPMRLFFEDGYSRYLARMVTKDMLPDRLTKHDQANEVLRDANHIACWKALRNDLHQGKFQGESKWIDIEALKKRIEAAPEELGHSNLSDLAKILAAVRVWHMEQRVNAM